jgi:hypothetical protein|tara:strand:+ start:2222 stop:2704 length:483 start_codon:yes stop_codon:yes gene_type:complete
MSFRIFINLSYFIEFVLILIMLIFISKFLHLFSLLLAGGGVIGVAVIQSIYKKEGKTPEPHLAKGFRVLAFLSLLAILIMWVTGVIQTLVIYGGFNLGWSFHVKLLGATFILIASLIINIHLKKSAQNQIPPNQNTMKYCASAGRLGFLLALGGAIWTFA